MTARKGVLCAALCLSLLMPKSGDVAAKTELDDSVTNSSAASTEPTVSLAFVGDVMLAETPGKVIQRGQDPFAPFAKILAAAEVRIGNLECVVATQGRADPAKIYSFRAHPRTLNVLKRHLDVVALANNHSGDFGPQAFAQMLGLLEQANIPYVGGGRDLARAHAPHVIERKGLRIALLSYNEFLPRSFEADVDKPGVAWSEDEQVVHDIVAARRVHHADVVIPFMHWGWENERVANLRQRDLARRMIDVGADAVIGGHPHVTQNIEHYRGKPIIYSLGNFIFDGFDMPANNTGWLLRLEIDRAGVQRWQTVVAHIDKQGTPHPARGLAGECWQRGDDQAQPCSPAQQQSIRGESSR